MVENGVEQAISEALTDGYQLSPDAFELLHTLEHEYNIVEIVRSLIQRKKISEPGRFAISVEDVRNLIPKTHVEETDQRPPEYIIEVRYTPSTSEVVDGLDGFRFLTTDRFNKLLKIVKQRQDSSQIQKISRLNISGGKPAKVVGLVLGRKVRKNGVEVTIDDDTGKLTAIATNEDVGRKISQLLLDQFVIADVVIGKQGQFIVRSVYPPDIPDRVTNTSKKRVYTVLTSDLHVGSKMFLADSFERFLNWLSGNDGDQDIVERIVCIVIAGDAVDGVGVYPGQQEDATYGDVSFQYRVLAKYLSRIPERIKVIVIPGDHDPTRQAHPQPQVPRKYAEPLYEIPNIMILGNPARVVVNGVSLLVFHGKSIDDVITMTPGLHVSRPAQAMKVLLRARHLVPFCGGTASVAPSQNDELVIDEVPDIFHAGHVHSLDRENYRGTLMINSGTWRARTIYAQNMNITPTPAVVPIVNLSTFEVITRSFV